MYLRMTTGNEQLPCSYAYIEFTNQSSVSLALQNNGIEYNKRCLRLFFTFYKIQLILEFNIRELQL